MSVESRCLFSIFFSAPLYFSVSLFFYPLLSFLPALCPPPTLSSSFLAFLRPTVNYSALPVLTFEFSLQANIKTLGTDAEIKDGERLPLDFKDMGSCEIYPQTISHNPNGRFVVVCGDGEYIIYTSMALRNKSFGSAQVMISPKPTLLNLKKG